MKTAALACIVASDFAGYPGAADARPFGRRAPAVSGDAVRGCTATRAHAVRPQRIACQIRSELHNTKSFKEGRNLANCRGLRVSAVHAANCPTVSILAVRQCVAAPEWP